MELDHDVYTKGNHLCDEISLKYGLKTLYKQIKIV